ncbi:MAG TPA: hypothetical protein VGE98_10690 [Thermoanaerobaculia bacterium]
MASKPELDVRDLVDELLPDGVDWERMVRTYPVPALAVAALGGFLLGRLHGPAIIAAISSFAAAEVSKNVGDLIGQHVE